MLEQHIERERGGSDEGVVGEETLKDERLGVIKQKLSTPKNTLRSVKNPI